LPQGHSSLRQTTERAKDQHRQGTNTRAGAGPTYSLLLPENIVHFYFTRYQYFCLEEKGNTLAGCKIN
jgi:hypothetical protein